MACHVSQNIDLESTAGRYLLSCARIRNLTVNSLVRRLLEVIGEDQLVLAVLDDESRRTHRRSEHRFKDAA